MITVHILKQYSFIINNLNSAEWQLTSTALEESLPADSGEFYYENANRIQQL